MVAPRVVDSQPQRLVVRFGGISVIVVGRRPDIVQATWTRTRTTDGDLERWQVVADGSSPVGGKISMLPSPLVLRNGRFRTYLPGAFLGPVSYSCALSMPSRQMRGRRVHPACRYQDQTITFSPSVWMAKVGGEGEWRGRVVVCVPARCLKSFNRETCDANGVLEHQPAIITRSSYPWVRGPGAISYGRGLARLRPWSRCSTIAFSKSATSHPRAVPSPSCCTFPASPLRRLASFTALLTNS